MHACVSYNELVSVGIQETSELGNNTFQAQAKLFLVLYSSPLLHIPDF